MADLKAYDGPIQFESVSAVTATPSVEVGERRVWKGESYRYAYNAGGATLSQKNVVNFATGASGFSVTNTHVTDVVGFIAGVVKHADIAAGSYGWIMTKGFASVVITSNATGDYIPLCKGSGGKVIDKQDQTGVTNSVVMAYGLNVNTAAAGTLYAVINAALE